MTMDIKNDFTIKPYKSFKDTDPLEQAKESRELKDIAMSLDDYADI
jgi:hypothetical protein